MIALSMRELELLIIIGCAVVAILSNRVRPDLVALLVLMALGLGGIVTPEQALAGFSRPAVMTIVGLFVITATLERTGVVQWLAVSLARLSGRGERRMISVFMGAGALLSLVMNNIAAGAVLLPAAVNAARQAKVCESRLLMPLAFGTLLGGMAALNLVPTAEAMLAGAVALVLTGCMPMEEAYRTIEWQVVVLIAGLLPIGTALVETGLAARIGQAFTMTLAPAGPVVLVAGFYLFTVILTQVVGGQVAALIVGPIAVSAAIQLGVNLPAVGVVVAIGCSSAFLTPIAHPVNLLGAAIEKDSVCDHRPARTSLTTYLAFHGSPYAGMAC